MEERGPTVCLAHDRGIFGFWDPVSSASHLFQPRPGSIVEDHAQGMAMAGVQPAHAVTQGHSIVAARALLRPAIDREYHCIALPERHYLGSRLHARALLDQHKLAAGEVLAWRG